MCSVDHPSCSILSIIFIFKIDYSYVYASQLYSLNYVIYAAYIETSVLVDTFYDSDRRLCKNSVVIYVLALSVSRHRGNIVDEVIRFFFIYGWKYI